MEGIIIKTLFAAVAFLVFAATAEAGPRLTDYVNPLLGTATLWDKADLGFTPTRRTWGAEVFPGASLPNAMVQLTPVTKWRSGSGYQYEDDVIEAFVHTSKGHWNLCNIPILPVQGDFEPASYGSPFDHRREAAQPGYYRVYLERYGIEAELTSTLRCGFHRYTFKDPRDRKLVVDLAISNERIRGWKIDREGDRAFSGWQQARDTIYFYATTNQKVSRIESRPSGSREISVVVLEDSAKPLELRVGISFVSVANARENLERELAGRSFNRVRKEALQTWEALLSRVRVEGGTERQRRLFYSCLYRSFLWPALRSDANGEFTDRSGKVVNKGFRYYTEPSLWDDYRNKLVLLGMLTPDVSVDVIKSLIDKGEKTGFIPTFFHGDHAAPYIAGTWLRGIRGFDVRSAYSLLLRNATVEGGTRPYITEYNDKGYIAEEDIANPIVETKAKAAVTKTLEYAYDDYAVALLARELGDTANYEMLMKRTRNYRNVFDASTGFMRGRLANGKWIEPFDPGYPYYEYMYREANAWQSTFFAPHDVEGLISLWPSREAFEQKLDQLFSVPWNGMEVDNLSVFIGQYCHGNQPDHNYPFLYHFLGKPEKSQALIDHILDNFYDMGREKLAYAGMDDAGEMSSWYVFCAMGIYPFSPADPEYIVTAPLFDRVEMRLGDKVTCRIVRKGNGRRITGIAANGRPVDGWFVAHRDLAAGGEVVVSTE